MPEPVIDPTENVKALSEAAQKRQDDLREQFAEYFKAEVAHVREVAELRASHAKELSELREVHARDREANARENRTLESDRLDKIRQVDVTNTASSAAQILGAVETLASAKQAGDELMRNQVAAAATAVAAQTERIINPMLDRLALLEKSSYTGAGKAGVADPQLVALTEAVQLLSRQQAQGTGKSQGISLAWVALSGVVALILGLITIFSFLATRHG